MSKEMPSGVLDHDTAEGRERTTEKAPRYFPEGEMVWGDEPGTPLVGTLYFTAPNGRRCGLLVRSEDGLLKASGPSGDWNDTDAVAGAETTVVVRKALERWAAERAAE